MLKTSQSSVNDGENMMTLGKTVENSLDCFCCCPAYGYFPRKIIKEGSLGYICQFKLWGPVQVYNTPGCKII